MDSVFASIIIFRSGCRPVEGVGSGVESLGILVKGLGCRVHSVEIESFVGSKFEGGVTEFAPH